MLHTYGCTKSVGQTMVFFPFLENFHFREHVSKNGNVFSKNGNIFSKDWKFFFPKMGMQNDTSNFNSILGKIRVVHTMLEMLLHLTNSAANVFKTIYNIYQMVHTAFHIKIHLTGNAKMPNHLDVQMPIQHVSDNDSTRMFMVGSHQMLPYFWQSLQWDNWRFNLPIGAPPSPRGCRTPTRQLWHTFCMQRRGGRRDPKLSG